MVTRFKYKFKRYAYAFMIVAIILAGFVIGLNAFRLIKYGYDPSKLVGLIATFAVSILIIVLIAPIFIASYYEVNDNNFVLRWGILKNEIPVKEITKVVHTPDKNNLTVFWGDQDNFMVISAIDVNVLDIVDALRARNKRILYQCVSSDLTQEDKQDKNKRK